MTRLNKQLPRLQAADSISLRQREVLIVAAGFEKRRLAAVEALRGRASGTLLVLEYKPEDPRNDATAIFKSATAHGIAPKAQHRLTYDRFDPHPFPDRLKRWLIENKIVSVLIDVSAMSKLAILLTLDVCRELNLPVAVHIAEASRYGPSKEEYENARQKGAIFRPSVQIYTGVRGVLRVSRFSSVAMQGQPTAAIAFMSFNEELIQALLNCVYPARLFLINGRPPSLHWRESATAWIHEPLLKEWPPNDNPLCDNLPCRATSTLDYRETVLALCDLYWQLTLDHRVLLAPTGSKMQTVGCFIAAAIHPDIHIEYPTPNGFLNLYSEGVSRQWLVELGCLGDFINRVAELERQCRLSVQSHTA